MIGYTRSEFVFVRAIGMIGFGVVNDRILWRMFLEKRNNLLLWWLLGSMLAGSKT